MKKQTAVEWLEETIKNGYKASQGIILSDFFNAISQAKEMEKQQIIKAVNFGDERGKISTYLTAEQYYNETFKSE